MSDLRRHCDLLLRAYPVSYRRRRGVEIRETLMDVSGHGASWPPLREALAIVGAGIRRRLGLAADQPLGHMAERVADWYLLMAVGLAGSALVLGEWAPWVGVPLRPPFGFGPFATDGVPVYVLVIATGLARAARRPGLVRAASTGALLTAVAMVVLEHQVSFWGRPSLSFVIPLLACLAPAAVGPGTALPRRRADGRLVGGLALISAVAAPVWSASVDLYLGHRYSHPRGWTGRGAEFYRVIIGEVSRWVPTVGAAALVAAVGLVVLGRRGVSVGVVAIMAPWLLLAVLVDGSPTMGSSLSGSTFSAVATATPTAELVAAGLAALGIWLAVQPGRQPATAG